MKKIWLVFYMAAVLVVTGSPGVQAEIIHLDGIANAGWYADTLTNSHLYIYDTVKTTYYYKWVYSAGDPQPIWSSRDDLKEDLKDGILNKYNDLPVTDWQVQSGGDAFNASNNRSNQIWKSLSMPAGEYTFKLTADSRAYQGNAFRWSMFDNSTPLWNAYVQMYAKYDDTKGEPFRFGYWDTPYTGTSESAVLDFYRNNENGMTITISKAATMYFYINDFNSVDNGGSVTLEFNGPPPVPVPGSLILFGSGLAAFLARRWCS